MRTFEYNDLIGVKWHAGGRSTAEGFDCWGIMLECARRLGVEIPDVQGYDEDWEEQNPRLILDYMARPPWVEVTSPHQPGDLFVIKWPKCAVPTHLVMVVDRTRYIHAHKERCVETGRISRLAPFIFAAVRHEALVC